MRVRRNIAAGLVALGAWLLPVGAVQAAPGPAWDLQLTVLPTNLAPGSIGTPVQAPLYMLVATNVGAGQAGGPITLKATLPPGVTPVFNTKAPTGMRSDSVTPEPICSKTPSQTVTCTTVGPVLPSRWIGARIPVEVSGSLNSGESLAGATGRVESPAATTAAATAQTTINTEPPTFGFLGGPSGLRTLFTNEDGAPSLAAGSRPDQLTIDIGFPVEQPSGSPLTTGAGHPRDVVTELPPGFIVNPNATETRCTEVQFQGAGGCPDESVIGIATVTTEVAGPVPVSSPIYNLVPPPGSAAQVGFDAARVGIFVHLSGGVRSDSDYGLYAESNDTLARGTSPIESVQVQLWGDPTSPSHDHARGACVGDPKNSPCEAASRDIPLLTMPSACSKRLTTNAHARSWEEAEKGITSLGHHASADAESVGGISTEVTQCSTLEFDPTFTVKPSTKAAESPAGVEMELQVPQNESRLDQFGNPQSATSTVKDVTVNFPQGMALNPAAAAGLQACSSSQIGMLTAVGQTPPHFSRARPNCPDAAKIGAVEVNTPLLDHPLPGAVYVAKPYDNPFGTLFGAYVVIDDPADGVEAKLAGRTELDPDTGQLSVSFTENPQLPVASFKVSLFGGPRAALRTPSTCGTYTTASVLTPWSGNPPVPYEDSFEVTKGPNGKPCARSEAEMPNDPDFEAGTKTPIAAGYSPFLARLIREDGEQQLKSFNATLPAGLTGKLAGVSTCSDDTIKAAEVKTGQEELESPSCPADSLIGKVNVGAGAGPSPYYTEGKIYMAGPFKGAPLSAVAITPAVAGPFDLGTVAIHVPAYVDPVTSVLSIKGGEEFPHILEGVPLELRDARIALDRKEFTLNPTSCSEKALTGESISLLDQSAPLFQRFQVVGCRGLDYAPELSIRLFGKTNRGAHPRVRAILTAKPGEEANTKRASVALPRSEFLENAHIQTVCTRVQFTAERCPAGSIYGHATAITPLLDEPLEGPIYLRSSSHELPDMVAALKGPPARPIKVELAGRIDSVNGGIRTTFDLVPDQPVSKAIFSFKGGNKGLIVNSRDICANTYKATAKFDGQNGKAHDFKTKLKASCGKGKEKAKKSHRRG